MAESSRPFTLYGAPGSGATAVHAALTLIGLPVEVVDVAPWEGEAERRKLAPVNPLRQAPSLVLPSGEVMTESAAILLWLGDRHPEAGLALAIDDPLRSQYLRWMVYVPAAIYSMYYEKGRREYQKTGDKSAVLTTHDAEVFSAPDCLTIVGWHRRALEMCGAAGVRVVEDECRAKGGSVCRYSLNWD